MEAVAAGLGVTQQLACAGGAGEAVDGVAVAQCLQGLRPRTWKTRARIRKPPSRDKRADVEGLPAGCGPSGLEHRLGTLSVGTAHVDGGQSRISILSDAGYALPLTLVNNLLVRLWFLAYPQLCI